MSKIVGYTQRKRRGPLKILWVALFVLVILFFAWLVSIDPAKQKEIKKPAVTTTHKKAVTTTTIPVKVTTTSIVSIPSTTNTIVHSALQVQQTGEIKVVSQKFAKGLIDNSVVDETDNFKAEEKIYYYTVLDSINVPLNIVHVWYEPSGAEYFSINLTISRQPGGTWSMLTLPPVSDGTWTAKTMVNGKVLAEKKFTVK